MTFEEAVDVWLAKMREIMIVRQKKYGPDNIFNLGILGVLKRVKEDKLGRLLRYYEREDLREKTLSTGFPKEMIDRAIPSLAADYDDDSLDDALIDAANYLGPICLMLRHCMWGLPMESAKRPYEKEVVPIPSEPELKAEYGHFPNRKEAMG